MRILSSNVDHVMGDQDAVYYMVTIAVRNGGKNADTKTAFLLTLTCTAVQHGKPGAPVDIEVCFGEQGVLFKVLNDAGNNHSAALELQAQYGINFLLNAEATSVDLAGSTLGAADSNFRGCVDVCSMAQALGAEATLTFHDEHVCFMLNLPGAVSTMGYQSQPASPPLSIITDLNNMKRARPAMSQMPPSLRFLYVDDQNSVRVQALGIAKGLELEILEPTWAKEELIKSAYRDEPNLKIWGRTVDELARSRFVALAKEWEGMPALVILDQNLDYVHTMVHGTDICLWMRDAGFHGVVLIRSGNDSSDDEAVYKACKADGMLSKTVGAKSTIAELHGWVQTAKDRARQQEPVQEIPISHGLL